MNRIVHFEIPAVDPEKCMNFYKTVFGWSFHQWGNEEYYLAQTGENSAPGINGAVMKRRDPAQPVVNTLDVSDIDATASKIEENGGQIVVPKMAVPGIGWLLYFKDTDGNIFGAMQNDASAA